MEYDMELIRKLNRKIILNFAMRTIEFQDQKMMFKCKIY